MKNKITYIFMILLSFPSIASENGITQAWEVVANHPQVFQMSYSNENKSCAGVLIGNNCAITAAHCLDELDQTITANFLPRIRRILNNRVIYRSRSEHKFEVNTSSVQIPQEFFNLTPTEQTSYDWAVFKLKRNNEGDYAGEKFTPLEVMFSTDHIDSLISQDIIHIGFPRVDRTLRDARITNQRVIYTEILASYEEGSTELSSGIISPANLRPGYSGGAILMHGKVVGINIARHRTRDRRTNEHYYLGHGLGIPMQSGFKRAIRNCLAND